MSLPVVRNIEFPNELSKVMPENMSQRNEFGEDSHYCISLPKLGNTILICECSYFLKIGNSIVGSRESKLFIDQI